MNKGVLVNRYAEGLAGALGDEAEFEAVREALAGFSGLLRDNGTLRQAMTMPFVPTPGKGRIASEVLERLGAPDKARRFLLLLVRHRRLEVLDPVLEELPALWRAKRGVKTFEVRSAAPVSGDQRRRLEERLERLEGRPVHCDYILDPDVLGGLAVRAGNTVYDATLKGRIERLVETISER